MKNKKFFLGVYNPSIVLTYIGVFFGLFGIGIMCNRSVVNSVDTTAIAMIALIMAGICDTFDGTIARMCKRTDQEKAFGVQLDSLADVVSFVVLPAVVTIITCQMSWHAFFAGCFYIFAGIMRLGWFNVTAEENKGFYMGLPVTFASMLFPLAYAIMSVCNIRAYQSIVFEILSVVIALMFIANFKLQKPGIAWAVIWCLVEIGTIILILCL